MGSCRLSVQFGRVLGGAMGSSHKFNATAVTIPPTPSWTMDGWRESGVCMGGAQDAMRTAVRLQVDDASGSRVVEGAHHCEEDAATASRKRMGKPGKHRDGGLGVVPIGWGGETARQRVRLIGLIPSFFFGVSSRQPRFISVPSVSNPCWCGWAGFFSIFWMWRAARCHVAGSASFPKTSSPA